MALFIAQLPMAKTMTYMHKFRTKSAEATLFICSEAIDALQTELGSSFDCTRMCVFVQEDVWFIKRFFGSLLLR